MKTSTFQRVMQTQNDLKDVEGTDWPESTELAIGKRRFLLNKGRNLKQDLKKTLLAGDLHRQL